MTWREQIVVRILLLVARMFASEPWADEITTLATHIRVHTPEDIER